ncbi:zinc finger CCCH domain-containing 4 isoform X1 [Pelobates cultripes]|uniref:Zinc finger CCCH domain-containing 4 isoform X1 n=1 Tax=Pelobates cultripes TaxID=61616 RepID=A0AAD1SXB5_PELCU|nr:zinc finger CCCH domain-containing 4 isoform X1 [Pelobates cultripes]
MFSHDALTDETQELLDKILAEDAEAGAEDEKDVEELKKQGINPLPKPPPGVGLLPTPSIPPPAPSSPTEDMSPPPGPSGPVPVAPVSGVAGPVNPASGGAVPGGSLPCGPSSPEEPGGSVTGSSGSSGPCGPVCGSPMSCGPMPGGPMQGGPMPGGPMQGGPMPGGPMQGGPMPGGPMQGGPMPGGPMQGGPMPGGPMQGGPMPGGPMQGGPMPGGPMQGGPMPGGPMQGGPMPGGPMQGGPMPGGPMQGGPMPGGPMQGGPMPGGPMQGGPMPGGPMQGGPMPGSPMHGGTMPGGPMPGCPIPGGPMMGGPMPPGSMLPMQGGPCEPMPSGGPMHPCPGGPMPPLQAGSGGQMPGSPGSGGSGMMDQMPGSPMSGSQQSMDLQMCQRKIPSLFEIVVRPTAHLAHKLGVSRPPGPPGGPPGPPPPRFPAPMGPQGPMHHDMDMGMEDGPPMMPYGPGDGSEMMADGHPDQGFYDEYYQDPNMEMMGDAGGFDEYNVMQEDSAALQYQEHPPEPGPETEESGSNFNKGNIPDFLPSAQRALFLRIQQKQQEEEERARRLGNNQQERDHEEGDTVNWYSSDEEEGGSSVTSILKTLRQQSSSRPSPPAPVREVGTGDPRLPKSQAVPFSRPTDPRISRDPRLSRNTEPIAAESSSSDPRLARHTTQPKQDSPVSKVLVEEEESERVLRDKPVNIPLDPLPGLALRDPRSQLQQFSHIKKDIHLNKPAFSRSVLWSPEDLIPLPIPKQDFIPVPAALQSTPVLDPRLNRPATSAALDPRQRALAGEVPAANTNLPDFELLSRILKTVNAASVATPSPPAPSDKPSDPRTRKTLTDPRLQKATEPASLSKATEPTQPQPLPPPTESTPTIAPYDPRLLTSGGLSKPSSQSNVLSGISLYDPRMGSKTSAEAATSETTAKAQDTKPAIKPKEPLFVRKSALDQPEAEKQTSETATDRYNSYNRPRTKTTAASSLPASESSQPAVHNLPVPSVYGLVKQATKSGSGSPYAGNSPTQDSEQDAGSLKDVFKGFDPTASPFCQ